MFEPGHERVYAETASVEGPKTLVAYQSCVGVKFDSGACLVWGDLGVLVWAANLTAATVLVEAMLVAWPGSGKVLKVWEV